MEPTSDDGAPPLVLRTAGLRKSYGRQADFFGGGVVDGTCWARRTAFPSGVVQYQLGVFDPAVGTVWEAWSEAPLRP